MTPEIPYPRTRIRWNPAYRAIPTRFPAVNLFDRVASPEDFDALYALEAMTNDRLRDEVGEIELVAPEERLYGPGSGPIMAAFTHLNPLGSRFSDGSYGVFYAGRDKATAIGESRYHAARFMAATDQGPMRLQYRLYTVRAAGEVVDLRAACRTEPEICDPDGYAYSQAVGRRLRLAGANGVVYPSVRHAGGQCLAAFRPRLLKNCVHAAHLEYQWDGAAIRDVYELTRLPS